MKDLKKYYDRNLVYVITELKKGVINTNTQEMKVYNPLDFNRRVKPAAGCDLVIGDYSTNSNAIFDIGGVRSDVSSFVFDRFESITLFNYCEPEQVEQVINEHKQAIKNALNKFIAEKQEKVNEAINIINTL